MDSSVFQGIKSFFMSSNDEKKEFVDPYLEFLFAGKKVFFQSYLLFQYLTFYFTFKIIRLNLKFATMMRIQYGIKNYKYSLNFRQCAT